MTDNSLINPKERSVEDDMGALEEIRETARRKKHARKTKLVSKTLKSSEKKVKKSVGPKKGFPSNPR